jgi:endoglucanase
MVLPWLATEGNRIIRKDTGDVVLLRGVNRSGLEYTEPGDHGFLNAARLTQDEINHLCNDWHCNVIRLPFVQDFALRGRGKFSAEAYLESLDQIIHWAAECGAYTMLDLQWLDADKPWGADREFIYPVPNRESATVWHVLASRYADRPEVLYDLYTEPHDTTPMIWNQWAQLLADTVWQDNPRGMVFVSGVGWGFDLRKVAIEGHNVVYSTHVYKKWGDDWDGAFGERSRTDPVFAGEWGCWNGELEWGRSVLDYFAAHGLGWAAWSWSDRPHLMSEGEPTDWGKLVKTELA